MNKNKAITRTLLSLAIAGTLTACAPDTESAKGPRPVVQQPAPLQSSTALDEIQATAAETSIAPAAPVRDVDPPRVTLPQLAEAQQIGASADSVRASIASVAGVGAARMERYYPAPQQNTENYADLTDNGIHRVSSEPVSTFSIDVDTGAYSNVRRFLNNGQLPPPDAVRAEELINYFPYAYPRVPDGTPFSVFTEIAASPWQPGRHLVHIGIQAVDPDATAELHSNLVFLVDVSGSMDSPDKLGLLKTSLKLLTRQLSEADSIAIVVYAGASGVVLEPTPGNDTAAITRALDQLAAGGGTNGAAGIQLAYDLAQQHYIDGGINRVLLATDGDFNVGMTDFEELKKLVSARRKTGISLTTLGFGGGNYNDHLMEQLADAGNGNHAYIDNINEARKVLVDELAATLQTVAKDVKIQIEFNPALVSEYRLIGYENRLLAQQDFNNDKVDAGDIGAGHTVTALYEVALVGSGALSIDPLRYAGGTAEPLPDAAAFTNELAFLKLRYKEPAGEESQLLQQPLLANAIIGELADTSAEYRFAAAVAGFAQLLRANEALGTFGYEDVLTVAGAARGDDAFGYRSEFINLVKTAQALDVN